MSWAGRRYRVELLECPQGWTWLGSTPFQGLEDHRLPLRGRARSSGRVLARANRGARRIAHPAFTHVNDVAATIYEVTGIRMPSKVDGIAQQPLDGVSFARTFDHPAAPSRHHTQYFELYGNRAIYQDGWVAAARHGALDEEHPSSWTTATTGGELYHVADDFSEAHDLAAQNHSKLAQLQRLFDAEARKNDVYPLGGAGVTAHKHSWTEGAREFTYVPGIQRIPLALMPPLTGTSFSISAKAVIPEGGARGVIVAYGARGGGFSLYIKDGRLHYENKLGNGEYESVESDDSRARRRGRTRLRVRPAKANVKSRWATWSRSAPGVCRSMAGKWGEEQAQRSGARRHGRHGHRPRVRLARERCVPAAVRIQRRRLAAGEGGAALAPTARCHHAAPDRTPIAATRRTLPRRAGHRRDGVRRGKSPGRSAPGGTRRP